MSVFLDFFLKNFSKFSRFFQIFLLEKFMNFHKFFDNFTFFWTFHCFCLDFDNVIFWKFYEFLCFLYIFVDLLYFSLQWNPHKRQRLAIPPLEMDGYQIPSKFPGFPLRDSLLVTPPLELDGSQFSEIPLRDSLLATSPLRIGWQPVLRKPLER